MWLKVKKQLDMLRRIKVETSAPVWYVKKEEYC